MESIRTNVPLEILSDEKNDYTFFLSLEKQAANRGLPQGGEKGENPQRTRQIELYNALQLIRLNKKLYAMNRNYKRLLAS